MPVFHSHKRAIAILTSFIKRSEVPLRALCKELDNGGIVISDKY